MIVARDPLLVLLQFLEFNISHAFVNHTATNTPLTYYDIDEHNVLVNKELDEYSTVRALEMEVKLAARALALSANADPFNTSSIALLFGAPDIKCEARDKKYFVHASLH